MEDQTIPDWGCLITGMLEQGKLKVGQEVEVLGYN